MTDADKPANPYIKKTVIIVCALMALCAIAGVMLAGYIVFIGPPH